jgi:spore germination protein YaaH
VSTSQSTAAERRSRVLAALVVGIATLTALICAWPADSRVPSERMTVLAFFEERGSEAAFDRLRLEAASIDILIPEMYDFDPRTQTVRQRTPLRAQVATFARGHGIQVWPAVNAQLGGAAVFSDRERRVRALHAIVGAASDWDGVTVDLEGVRLEERAGFTRFVASLASALHARGKGIALYLPRRTRGAVTSWAAPYDYASLARACDYVLVGSYSESWASPGPVVSTEGFASLLDYLGGISKLKAAPTIGTLYEDWAPGARSPKVGLSDTVDSLGPRTVLQTRGGEEMFRYGDGHVVWYETPDGLADRVRAARRAGFRAVALFVLGHEPLFFWAAIRR